ncbi:energy-coupling factor transporter ATPase [Lentilactobacillus sp. Marseille-Q4993]|uniref:energy-coupling factor transporter ATPase n=1 Tax=Lentilactobacillus sp. Marseille-Q4993 TaxID=3039492 RepID=UPI0024BC2B53|nr:energy-coupling factor transporter ATPase [Lentilactobacillus sp. Marseille-Q4993]
MDNAVEFKEVSHVYQADSPMAADALSNVSLSIKAGSFTAVIGHTGSGKSTLVQHINALLKPTAGEVKVLGKAITPDTSNKNLKSFRKHIGMVFQFPEKQLFEETVLKDVMFGPKNYGESEQNAELLAKEALNMVNLPAANFNKSPFDLSGGQMRRVAIAGVLAMKPEILIMDEPTAGLDPRGHHEIMNLAKRLNAEGVTIILVTHQMNDVTNYADDVLVMEQGKLIKHDGPRKVFSDPTWVVDHQLNLPDSASFALELASQGFNFNELPMTIDELADSIAGGSMNE